MLPALAQVPAGFYLGAGLGQSRTSFSANEFSTGNPAVSETQDKTDTAWKLFGGYNFNRNLAIEAGYVDLGEPEYKYSAAAGSANARVENRAWFIAGKATLPLANQFGVFGKLGLARKRSEVNMSDPSNITGGSFRASKSRNDAVWGLGAEYMFNRNVGLRLEYEDFGSITFAFLVTVSQSS